MTSTNLVFAPLHDRSVPRLQAVELHSRVQIPGFQIVGLPSAEVTESRERVRAAIDASGVEFPRRRLTINLSPASIRKVGTGLDLPIALRILLPEHSSQENMTDAPFAAWGELGLDGQIKSVGQAVRALTAAWKARLPALYLAPEDADEAARALPLIADALRLESAAPEIRALSSLRDFVERKWTPIPASAPANDELPDVFRLLDLSPSVLRVIGIAASGMHHILLLGPKGSGKSHALDWLTAALPPPPPPLRLRHLLLSELSPARENTPFSRRAPVRRPNPGIRPQALLGSIHAGTLSPGELTLAHGGCLIADEFPEWPRDCREALRIPLEERIVRLTRAGRYAEFPAEFLLAATGNLCPCGNYPLEISRQLCRCAPRARSTYLSRISGPLLDRIDLVLTGIQPPERTKAASVNAIREFQDHVVQARQRARLLFYCAAGELHGSEVETIYQKHPDLVAILASTPGISLRSRHKILRLALTLALWDGLDFPEPRHVTEALFYRAERLNGFFHEDS